MAKKKTVLKSAASGKFVSKKQAKRAKKSTYRQTVWHVSLEAQRRKWTERDVSDRDVLAVEECLGAPVVAARTKAVIAAAANVMARKEKK
jgi:hypothetical protein